MLTLLLPGLVLVALAISSVEAASAPQLRVGPGPLARAHAALEGVTNCGQCHGAANGLSAAQCLGCHKPIAARIASKKGVHRDVTDDCRKCHAEHAGADADLRRLDAQAFNHAAETGFLLEGLHAKVATTCPVCHKKRTFLDAGSACASCHRDAHRPTLGDECARCHSTAVRFKETRNQFDHGRARFALAGSHRTVACEKCHEQGVFRNLRFDACSDCHQTPHRRTLGPLCTSCHTTDSWKTRALDHSKTGFALIGAHAAVACTKCHVAGIVPVLSFDRCGACHANTHRESVKDDCRACHTEKSFRGATFDHRARTGFPLAGKHDGLACRRCHTHVSGDEVPVAQKLLDYRGARADCAACHKDQHKGEYGRVCDACHLTTTFKAASFAHPRSPEFFGGKHAGVTCVRCHVSPVDPRPGRTELRAVPPGSKTPSIACRACHADVHLGQVDARCERCHTVDAARFAPARFSHDEGNFPLGGKHRAIECVKCHPTETRAFPAGAGTARRLSPVSTECRSCHTDPHLGQVDARCSPCHTAASFRVTSFQHRGLENLFGVATHERLPCQNCHKIEIGDFPAGRGKAVRLKVGKTCVDCH
jgi:hypothetical protein